MAAPTLDEQFQAAVWIVQSLPKEGPIKSPVNEQLQMYSLYKQGTFGPCNTEKPAFFHVVARLKWNAWHDLGDMNQDEARLQYIEKVIELVDRAEEKVGLMGYLNDKRYQKDPQHIEFIRKIDAIRTKLAVLGRLHAKGFEGKTIVVHGIQIAL